MWHVWEQERCIQGFACKPDVKRPLGRRGNVRIILKCILNLFGNVELIDMTQDMDKWRAVVKVVMTV